jgi:hypothetical protein
MKSRACKPPAMGRDAAPTPHAVQQSLPLGMFKRKGEKPLQIIGRHIHHEVHVSHVAPRCRFILDRGIGDPPRRSERDKRRTHRLKVMDEIKQRNHIICLGRLDLVPVLRCLTVALIHIRRKPVRLLRNRLVIVRYWLGFTVICGEGTR